MTDDPPVERRLRRLGSACAVLAAAVLVSAGAIGWMAGHGGPADLLASPPTQSFLVAFGAMLLVLLSSAVHARILRPPVPEEEDGEAAPAPHQDAAERIGGARDVERQRRRAWSVARLRAYSWATGIGFAMLGIAAAMGAMVAFTGRAPFYGLVICLASLLGMVARWPRRGAFEVALEAAPRTPPPAAGDPGAT